MVRLHFRYICAFFLTSYALISFGMEEKRSQEDLDAISAGIQNLFSPPENKPYDPSVNEYLEEYYITDLENVPVSIHFFPEDKPEDKPEHTELPFIDAKTTQMLIEDGVFPNLKQKENASHNPNSNYDDSYFEGFYDPQYFVNIADHNKQNTLDRFKSQSNSTKAYYDQKNRENVFKNELAAMIAYNYYDPEFIAKMENTTKEGGYYNDYLEAKEFVEDHPEVIGNKDYWHKSIQYNPKHPAPQPPQKIESHIYSSTFGGLVKSSTSHIPAEQQIEKSKSTLTTPQCSQGTIKAMKQMHEARKQERFQQQIKETLDQRRQERNKSFQVTQDGNFDYPKDDNFDYRKHAKSPNFTQKDRDKMTKDLESFRNQQRSAAPWQQQRSQPPQQRKPVDSFEYKIYTTTGRKSKNMIHNEKIDEAERAAAWQHQQEEFEDDDDDEEERELLENLRNRYLEEQRKDEYEQKCKKITNRIKSLHSKIKKLIPSIRSEYHIKAAEQAWDSAMKRLNYSIAEVILESYYGPIDPSQQTKYMNKLLIEASKNSCGHIKDPLKQIECIKKVKIYHLNGDFNTINLNDIRYQYALEEFNEEMIEIFSDYRRWVENEYLPQLRQQPENNNLRREIEVEAFTPEEMSQYNKIKEQINKKYNQLSQNLPWGVSFWEHTVGHFTTEKSSRQILIQNGKQEVKKALEDYIDEISAKKQALYEKQQQEKEEENNHALDELGKMFEAYKGEKEILKKSDDVKASNDSEKIHQKDDTYSSHENSDNANTILIKLRRNSYLKQIGIDQNEFNSFTGTNSKQSELHKSIAQAIDDANVVQVDVPEHVRETYNNLLKTSYELNKSNFTDLAEQLFELCDIVSLLTEFGEELADTIFHPIQYLQRRLSEMQPTLYRPHHENIEDFIEAIEQRNQQENNIDENLKHEEFQKDVKVVIEKTKAMIADKESKYDPELLARQKELRRIKIKEYHRSFARFTIDFAFDYLFRAGANYISNLGRLNKILTTYQLSDRIKSRLTGQRIGKKPKSNTPKGKTSSAEVGNTKKINDNKAQERTIKRANFQPLTRFC